MPAPRTKAAPGTFESMFQARLEVILRRAASAGLTVSQMCRESGIARATPDRWRARAPLSVRLVDRLEAQVVAAEEKKAQAAQQRAAEVRIEQLTEDAARQA